MRIHTDHNGVAVNAIKTDALGKDVSAHRYQVIAGAQVTNIEFQNGPVKESGVNGLTNETLLAILIDRTTILNGRFPCRENSIAITKMEEAMMWFNKRTADRMARGVEGQNKD